MIVSDIKKLRDPFVLLENGTYYAYGTGWVCYENTTGNLDGHWEYLGVVANIDENDDDGCHWAPEVHKYNGAFYMITTYKSKKTGHRGCSVFKSDTPKGPFFEISNGHATPNDWDAIDGTLYIDEENKPWMVFVHEWTCREDHIGSFSCAEMSNDLTHFISEPQEMFYANEPAWATKGVTDGCFMHKADNGDLLMLWSNFLSDGYCVAVAKSENGKLVSKWTHKDKLLYSKGGKYEYDGGHAMLFSGLDGKTYMSLHSPNTPCGERLEVPCFFEIAEKDGEIFIV